MSLRPAAWFAWAAVAVALGCDSGAGVVRTTAELALDRQQLDFGEVPVLQERVERLELHNLGRAPLTVGRVYIAITEPAGPFAILEAPQTVEGGTVEVVRVAFRPSELGEWTGAVVIESDDAFAPVLEVPLSARSSTSARVEGSGDVAFDRACEGTAAFANVTLTSTGTADLVVGGIALGEGSAPELTVVSSTRAPITVPTGGSVTLTVRYAPGFGAPAQSEGTLVFSELSDPAQRTLSVALHGTVNRAPVAQIADVLGSAPGATVTLDGQASSESDGDLPLTYAWSLRSSPIGSNAAPQPADGATSSVVIDQVGQYVAQLVVTDATGCASRPALETITAKSSRPLEVQLVWDRLESDLDLHLAPEGESFSGALDCFFQEGHISPDWGVVGDTVDDPILEDDSLKGYGPEIIAYEHPVTGRFSAMVHYYADHRNREPSTEATVRVYEFGILRAERRMRLEREGAQWTALTIDWPSGDVTPVDVLQ